MRDSLRIQLHVLLSTGKLITFSINYFLACLNNNYLTFRIQLRFALSLTHSGCKYIKYDCIIEVLCNVQFPDSKPFQNILLLHSSFIIEFCAVNTKIFVYIHVAHNRLLDNITQINENPVPNLNVRTFCNLKIFENKISIR